MTSLRTVVLVAAVVVGRGSPAVAIDHASIARAGSAGVELRESSTRSPQRCDRTAVSMPALCPVQAARNGTSRAPGSMGRGATKRRCSFRARGVLAVHADRPRAESRGDVGFHSRFGRRRQHAPPSDDPSNGEVAI